MSTERLKKICQFWHSNDVVRHENGRATEHVAKKLAKFYFKEMARYNNISMYANSFAFWSPFHIKLDALTPEEKQALLNNIALSLEKNRYMTT